MALARLALAAAGIMGSLIALSQPAAAHWDDEEIDLQQSGVFALGNDPQVNTVLAYALVDGELEPVGTFATGGQGSAGGNQGGLALAQDQNVLIAVNAASNTITTFGIKPGFLDLQGVVPAQGERPVSAAVCTPKGRKAQPLVYVLNAQSRSIAGFTLDARAGLSPIAGSVQSLGERASSAAQILFDNTCRMVVVVERNAASFTAFKVDASGVAAPGVNVPSLSAGQLGSAITRNNQLFVSETGTSAASSFFLDTNTPNVTPISQTVVNGQAGSCWAVATQRTFRCQDGKRDCTIGYVMNAGTANITSYSVRPDGQLALREMIAHDTMGSAFDGTLAQGDRYLVVQSRVSTTERALNVYKVDAQGNLDYVQVIDGLPATLNSVVAMH